MINFFFIFTSSIGFITIFVLLIRLKNNPFLNVYLILAFLLISVRFFLIGIREYYYTIYLSDYSLLSQIHFLLFVLFIYLYFKNLFELENTFNYKDLFHFIPYCIIYTITILNNNKYIDFSMNYWKIIILIYMMYYVRNTYNLVKNNIWNAKKDLLLLNEDQKTVNKWIGFFVIPLIFLIIRIILELVNNYIYDGVISQSYFGVLSCIILLPVFIKVLITPEILFGYNYLIKKVERHRSKEIASTQIWTTSFINNLTNVPEKSLGKIVYKNLNNYLHLIENVEFSDATFKNSNFKLEDLANKLSIPKSHLKFLFKYYSKLSFSDYKKAVKIKQSIKLINEGYIKSKTLDKLAEDVGFSSYSPFFTSFKIITGLSPREYISNKYKV
jgi:AraC-like DNA-binding protein